MSERKEESMEKEKNIEWSILWYFLEKWVLAWKRDVRWYFNEKKWFYQKNNSPFFIRGEADIAVLYKSKYIAIEVKKPSEMSFFDRDIKDLLNRCATAQMKWIEPKKYLHAVEQKEFLNDIIKNWWIWFFASSLEQVKERLKENWINI